MGGSGITVIIALAVVVIFILKGIKAVPQGYQWTVERFGRYTHTLNPGFNLIIPFIDNIGQKQNMMEQVLDVPPQEVISADNAQVTTDAVCFYQVLDAAKASYEIADLRGALRNLVMTNIRAVLGSMELDQMLSNRDQINVSLLNKVDEATDPWGLKVTRVEIRDISPPQDLVESMANQMKAEREKRAAILRAEGEREAAIKVAEGEKKAAVLRAEGEKEAAFLEAEARERTAEAEARATDMVSKAIENGNLQAVNYFVAQKYVDGMMQLAASPNSKVIMLPVEATSILGALEGIRDLVKKTTG